MKLLYSFLCIAIATSSAFAKISHADLERGRAKGLRLISLEDGADPVWKTQDEKLDLVRNRVGFFDVTEVYESEAPPNCQAGPAHAPYPAPSKQTAVRPIIDRLSLPSIQQYVQTLIQFKNRDAAEDAGVEASNYILAMVQNIISRHPPSGATVELFPHSFKQPSVIAKIPGTSNGPITIITAHVDTFNPDVLTDPNQGADSDATGSATLIEAINALLASGFRPSRPVEFHWYAAQFMGNLGSLQISKNYKDAGKQVHALLNIDAAA
ncbi:hypothetical protein H0H87_012183 [Tephrocybe sp. NHM501043]|nr:hypothetical protein H0H87_012183 [Tephrocybe sp. NHM501043]